MVVSAWRVIVTLAIALLRPSLALLLPQPPDVPMALQRYTLDMYVNVSTTTLHDVGQILASHLSKLESKQLAARFESPKCQQLKAQADLRRWARSSSGSFLTNHQQVLVSPEKKLMYVRNQKAGSTFMFEHMSGMFNARDVRTIYASLKLYDGNDEKKDLDAQQDWSVFTLVRDPIETALDAYLEVSCRATHLASPKPDFADMPCDTEEQATRRLKSYLRAAGEGKALSTEFSHSYPQALKLDIVLAATREQTYDSIIRIENMLDELKDLPSFGGSLPERNSHTDHTHATDPCGTVDREDPELMAMLCEMYHVDYECFGFTLPAACRRSRA